MLRTEPHPDRSLRHEALFYEGHPDLIGWGASFVEDAVLQHEPILVASLREVTGAIRDRLRERGGSVEFVDMAGVGRNPARIIPVWQDFMERNADAPRVRGIGEPVWPGRTPAELDECARHEALLNIAFDQQTPSLWLVCPYDLTSLPGAVIDGAKRTHPVSVTGSQRRNSEDYEGERLASEPFDAPLAEPARIAAERDFALEDLHDIRALAEGFARSSSASRERAEAFAMAIGEVASNSIRYGGGSGHLRLWSDDRVVGEISDAGQVLDPLVGRRRPSADAAGGFGLWLANQLCDLVELRTFSDGTAVRLSVDVTPG